MADLIGITNEGLDAALEIKHTYKTKEPICVPGERDRILIPENLMNHEIDLLGLEDPLPLAVMAARDPEPPMALAAAARLSPLGRKTKLISGVYGLVGESTRHPLVRKCVELVTENAFSPDTIASVRRHTSRFIIHTRQQYTTALRHNLQSLLEGDISPRLFVKEFFELTEAGNMRNDIRKKLVLSLMLSESIRPSIKFLMLENFQRMPQSVQHAIITGVLKAEPSRHLAIIKEELRWIVSKQRQGEGIH